MFEILFGAEIPLAVKFFIAFVVVLALIGVTAWLVRRFGADRLGGAGARGRQPRLAVIDAAAVDGRRRLVLIRRDNVEHLLMIGGPTDVVVEQNIVRASAAARDRDAPRRTARRAESLPRAGAARRSDAWPLQPAAEPTPRAAPRARPRVRDRSAMAARRSPAPRPRRRTSRRTAAVAPPIADAAGLAAECRPPPRVRAVAPSRRARAPQPPPRRAAPRAGRAAAPQPQPTTISPTWRSGSKPRCAARRCRQAARRSPIRSRAAAAAEPRRADAATRRSSRIARRAADPSRAGRAAPSRRSTPPSRARAEPRASRRRARSRLRQPRRGDGQLARPSTREDLTALVPTAAFVWRRWRSE